MKDSFRITPKCVILVPHMPPPLAASAGCEVTLCCTQVACRTTFAPHFLPRDSVVRPVHNFRVARHPGAAFP
jgi:hypothetical protein